MPDHTIFDDVVRIGASFLRSLDSGHTELTRYLWKLSEISNLFAGVHGIVIRKLEDIEAANTLDQAKALIKQLEGGQLTDAFRARGLCDVFEQSGETLREVVVLDQADTDTWMRFCQSLEDRERDVARLYAEEIRSISDLVHGHVQPAGLQAIQERARVANSLLARQRADFETLARQFREAFDKS